MKIEIINNDFEDRYAVMKPDPNIQFYFPLSSLFKTTQVKRCNWCYNIIKNEDGNESTGPGRWCSPDCKQEEEDWNFLRKLIRAREESRRKWKEKHPIRVKSEKGIKKDRTEYFKKYLEDNRDKKREQARVAMRKKRLLDNNK